MGNSGTDFILSFYEHLKINICRQQNRDFIHTGCTKQLKCKIGNEI